MQTSPTQLRHTARLRATSTSVCTFRIPSSGVSSLNFPCPVPCSRRRRADKSRCFCCESDFKIVSPASSVSLAVVCARSNVSERVSALETEFTSASLRSSSLSTAKEFLPPPPPPPPPPLDSTSKFPRDDFDFSNCARACERERERETQSQLFGRRTKRDHAEKTRTFRANERC